MNMPSIKFGKKPGSQGTLRERVTRVLRWVLIGLPLGGVVWASFYPVVPGVRQALVLITILWFVVFYLFDTMFLGG